MSQQPDVRAVITVDEMNGRVEELEAQRNDVQNRCVKLAGEKALMLRLLKDAQLEIQRLQDQLEKLAQN